MNYKIEVYPAARKKYISKLSADDKAHLCEAIKLCLGEYLKKIIKRCNKKLLKESRPEIYRLHVSMTHTVFYQIDDVKKIVSVIDIMDINQAHSKYRLY